MTVIDLVFGLVCRQEIPADHGYLLYSAISRLIPELHVDNQIAVCPISGRQSRKRKMILTKRSRLRLRVECETIPRFLQLGGQELRLGDARIRVGTPHVEALRPASAVRSRLVVIRPAGIVSAHDLDPDSFRQAAFRQLEVLGINSPAKLSLGKRRTLCIKDKEIVGYELVIENLNDGDSLILQERGLGGRRHMGCGFFMPVERSSLRS